MYQSRYTSAMGNNGFAVIERQLEVTLAKLKNTHDPEQRRNLLFQMRQMLMEADRIMAEDDTNATATLVRATESRPLTPRKDE
jgi:hypothetical protein